MAGRRTVRIAGVLVVSTVVAVPGWGSGFAPRSQGPCELGTGVSTTVHAIAGGVVQPADLPGGWRLESAQTLPKGTVADGPSSHRLGGAVLFARRSAAPELALTSSAELEPSASAACRTYHGWLHSLLTAGVGTRLRSLPLRLGREHALLDSNEPVFGPMVEISWYRGPVYAAVQIQFRTRSAAGAAHRLALHFATASDRRLRRILG